MSKKTYFSGYEKVTRGSSYTSKDYKQIVAQIDIADISRQSLSLRKPVRISYPSKYNIWLIDNSNTDAAIIATILKCFFLLSEEKINNSLRLISVLKRVKCGNFTREVAETKVMQVTDHLEKENYSLQCLMCKDC